MTTEEEEKKAQIRRGAKEQAHRWAEGKDKDTKPRFEIVESGNEDGNKYIENRPEKWSGNQLIHYSLAKAWAGDGHIRRWYFEKNGQENK